MAESTAKLREEIMALSGIDIMIDKDNFKSTYQIMDELSTKWKDLSDIAQASIVELMAGKHQGNVFSSLMENFDTAREVLEASGDSAGSAMKELSKYTDSMEGKLSQLTAAWQSFSETVMDSDFLKVCIDGLRTIVELLDKLVGTFGVLGTAGLVTTGTGLFKYFKSVIKEGGNVVETVTDIADAVGDIDIDDFDNSVDFLRALSSSADDGAASVGNLGTVVTKTNGSFKAFMKTPLAVASAIGVAVAAIIAAYNAYKKYKEEQAEARQETIETANAFLDSANTFEQAYIKYSGKTNLTIEEEAELASAIDGTISALDDKSSSLQDVVSASDDYVSSLERIAQEELKAQNRAAQEKLKASKEELEETAMGWWKIDGSEVDVEVDRSAVGLLDDTNEAIKLAKEIGGEFYKVSSYGKDDQGSIWGFVLPTDADVSQIVDYYNMLIDYRDELYKLQDEDPENTDIDNAIENTTAAIDKLSDSVTTYIDALYDASRLEYEYTQKNGIPKTVEEYLAMRESILDSLSDMDTNTRRQIANTLDSDYGSSFDLSSIEVQARSLIGILDEFGETEAGQMETFLNMRTAVNNNECTVGEYLSQFDDIEKMTEGWSDEAKEELNLQFGLDTDSIKEQYDDMYNYIARQDIDWFEGYEFTPEFRLEKDNIKDQEIRAFLDDLTADELVAVAKIRTEIDWENTSEEEILKLIEDQVKLDKALSFEADIEVDTTALEALNEILAESASACGLSSESIESLKSKYASLDNYDPSTLFESTANGIKVNRDELAKLEKEYNNLTKSEVQEHLDTLANKYNEVTAEIDKCSNAGERAELISERETYASKIEELATYQAQLEGVTGAYQKWIDAQNTSEDYEGYEAVATSREDIQDEIDRGFVGNATKEYIDLLSGEELDGKSVDDYIDAWERLDEKVTGAGYSINDFFTVNDDGDITSTGIDRFFKSLQTDFKGSVAKFNEESGKWEYDFSQENLQKIQDEWGIGIEAIELLLEAAAAAGYDVDWDGILDGIDLDTSNFETLVSTAESAQAALNKLDGFEDVSFNFTATGVEEATSELEKARSTYIDLITNDDGTINLEAEGAEEMRVILATLLVQKQQLEDSNIAINIDTSGLDESQQDIANAIDAVQNFREKYKNLEIAVTTGQGIEEAKTELSNALGELQGLGDAGVDIAAQLVLGEGSSAEDLNSKVDAAISAVGSKDIKVGCKLDETDLGSLNSQVLANFTPEATIKITGIDDELVSEYTTTEKTAEGTVTWKNNAKLVIDFINADHTANGEVQWGNNSDNLKLSGWKATGTVTWTSGNNVKVNVISEVDGTANVNGSAFSNGSINSGRAFKQGNWGINGSGTALVGELGTETLVRGGRFYTIGDTGAEFIQYRPNDIIFNHKQTEELFKYGKVTSNGGRGKALVEGTTHSPVGKAFWGATASESDFVSNRVIGKTSDSSSSSSKSSSSSSSSSSKSSSSDDADDFEETLDWIETKISRIERAIDNLDQTASNVYKTWSSRNKALVSEISKVEDEIDIQQQAYERYIKEANSVGLSSSYVNKIKNGKIDIETIVDEDLNDKISQYTDWYEKALDCLDAIEELKETEASLYAQRVENVSTKYDGILGVIEHEKNMLDEYISQSEANAWLVSANYYNALASNEKKTIAQLEKQKAEMLSELQTAMESGAIAVKSESWYEMVNSIDEVTLAIEQSNTTLLEYQQTLQQLSWETFDLLQDKISSVTEESEFLIDLLSGSKLYDDNGQLTDEGSATMGLHGQNYNSYMYQADKYGEEAARLKKQLESDSYDTELEERYREMISLQQEYILNAQQEKEAIKDLVEEGIETELDALQELIDKKNEQLQSEKDLYDYQKKVKEQTEEISSLEKQMAAYSGDTSEEAQQKIQQIKVDLKSAKEELAETEYDKLIDDTSVLLDDLYLEYENLLNMRLDNLDALVSDMITEINTDASSISTTLSKKAESVGYTLSDSLKTIWDTNTTSTTNVITTYGEKFTSAQTTTNNALNTINTNLQNMITQLNSIAKTNVKSASTSSAANSKEANATDTSKGESSSSSSNSTTSYPYGKASETSGNIGYGSKGTYVKAIQYALNKLGYGNSGTNSVDGIFGSGTKSAVKSFQSAMGIQVDGIVGKQTRAKFKAKGYATGIRKINSNEDAWTQEDGQEYIVRPSDGAILTPVTKGDSVLNAQASSNIWDMANSPAEFIKDNLNLGNTNVPNNSNVQNNCVQNFDKIVFNMPNVRNYEQLLSEMQKDKNFERLVLSMTVDQIAGKSPLTKGKAIR